MSANRPLSPHLQVYRLPLTGIISITHRMTGVMLSMGLVLFVFVLFAIADGEGLYQSMQAFMAFWLFKLVYWGFIYALFFHLCHGARHLIWDIGKTFERDTLNSYALFELVVSAVLTLVTLLLS
jgi:succinate dehydrogenase / fumarate reductase cytochrome b subunit